MFSSHFLHKYLAKLKMFSREILHLHFFNMYILSKVFFQLF